jgi:putative nucleotidyltransferase with HDIG domain
MNLKNRNLMVVLCGAALAVLAINFFNTNTRFLFLAAFAVVAMMSLYAGWVNGILMTFFFNFIYYSLHAETPPMDIAVNCAVYSILVGLIEMTRLRPHPAAVKTGHEGAEEKAFSSKITNSMMLAHGMLWEIKEGLTRQELLALFARNVVNLTGAKHILVYMSRENGNDLALAHSYGSYQERAIALCVKQEEITRLVSGNQDAASAGFIGGLTEGKAVAVVIRNEKGGYSAAVLYKESEFSYSDIYIAEFFAAQVFIILEKQGMLKDLAENYSRIIDALVLAIDTKDHVTHGHSVATMKYAEKIALKMGLKPEEVEKIKYAALLHDIGKIKVNSEILNKPTSLTPEEFEAIKKHPAAGVGILDEMKIFDEILPIILYHHEHVDGKGYPGNLKGDSIPLGSRICAIADAYSVMLSERPYRMARSRDEAITELKRCSGSQFDMGIVNVFLQVLEAEEIQERELKSMSLKTYPGQERAPVN